MFKIFEFLKHFRKIPMQLMCQKCGVASSDQCIVLAATPRSENDETLCYANALCEYCLFGIKKVKP